MFLAEGWFREIYLNRLSVGHTHAAVGALLLSLACLHLSLLMDPALCAPQIDAYFSWLRRYLRQVDTLDPAMLIRNIQAAYHDETLKPEVLWLQSVMDFKSMLGHRCALSDL